MRVLEFIIRRVFSALFVLIGVSIITFFLSRVIPNNAAALYLGPKASLEAIERARIQLGLDKPLPVQYAVYMRELLHGDLGTSISTKRPITLEISSRLTVTLELLFFAMVLTVLIGIPLGILSAYWHGKPIDVGVQRVRRPGHGHRIRHRPTVLRDAPQPRGSGEARQREAPRDAGPRAHRRGEHADERPRFRERRPRHRPRRPQRPDRTAATHSSYHGEKVAFGVLTGLHLTDAPAVEVGTVYSFCEDVGLPTTLSDVGLSRADRSLLAPAAEKACEAGSPIHHEAGVVTPGRVLDAMLAADALGQERRGGRPRA